MRLLCNGQYTLSHWLKLAAKGLGGIDSKVARPLLQLVDFLLYRLTDFGGQQAIAKGQYGKSSHGCGNRRYGCDSTRQCCHACY